MLIKLEPRSFRISRRWVESGSSQYSANPYGRMLRFERACTLREEVQRGVEAFLLGREWTVVSIPANEALLAGRRDRRFGRG